MLTDPGCSSGRPSSRGRELADGKMEPVTGDVTCLGVERAARRKPLPGSSAFTSAWRVAYGSRLGRRRLGVSRGLAARAPLWAPLRFVTLVLGECLVAGSDASHRFGRLGQVVQVVEELADGLGIVGIVKRACVRSLVDGAPPRWSARSPRRCAQRVHSSLSNPAATGPRSSTRRMRASSAGPRRRGLPWRAVRIPATPPARQRACQRPAVCADTPSWPATSARVLPWANSSAACRRRRSNHCRSPGCLSTRPLGDSALLMPRDPNPQHSPTTAKLCSAGVDGLGIKTAFTCPSKVPVAAGVGEVSSSECGSACATGR
jgi:hypothetical protein